MSFRGFPALLIIGLFFGFMALAQEPSGGSGASGLPEGKGKEIVERVCQQCHGLEAITSSHRTQQEWRDVVNEMISNGATLQDSEVDVVAEYLAKNFGPENHSSDSSSKDNSSTDGKVNVNTSSAKELSAGLDISEKDATAIVDYRSAHGKFKTLDDLKKVPGIDSAKIDSAKSRVVFQ